MTVRSAFFEWFTANRSRIHPRLNRVIDDTTDFMRRVIFAPVKSVQVNLTSQSFPPQAAVPTAKSRLLIAPMNFAGQGHAWAQAVNLHLENVAATNLSIRRSNDFGFTSGATVPYSIQRYHREWQRRESAYILRTFTHVLVEAESAIFGNLFENSTERERLFFAESGVSTAYVCHGSDIRSPEKHRATTRFSPFADANAYNARTQRRVDRNRTFLEGSRSPVFLSTPDLVNDYPRGVWLPVVIDFLRWSGSVIKCNQGDRDMTGVPPLVVHTPSSQRVKGSHLIEAPIERLVRNNVIRYHSLTGVSSMEVQQAVFGAAIVLDQFRLGSYGVAACEAMAAGKVVVGHVTPQVRQYVTQQTGMELPIVEADPETIAQVLAELATDPDRMHILGCRGQEFVANVHAGELSAQILQQHWLHR